MIQELDVYVLLKRATAISLKECAAKWTKGLDTPSEYVARLADGSFMDFDNINDFLVHVLGGNASAVLYWTGEGSTAKHRPEMDSLFMFFNKESPPRAAGYFKESVTFVVKPERESRSNFRTASTGLPRGA